MTTYIVGANFSTDSRSGAIQINDETHTVYQSGYDASLSPSNAAYYSSANDGSVAITVGPGISWTAQSQADWITIISATSGVSSGSITYHITPNTSVQTRTGTLRIAGRTFTVTQTGVAVVVIPTSTNILSSGTLLLAQVQASAQTAWTAQNAQAWIHVVSGGSGSGDGAITLYADENPSYLSRVGVVMVVNATYTINQGGVLTPTLSLNPVTATAAAEGAFGNIIVTATPDAPWSCASGNAYLTITSSTNGAGNGAISYVISANTTINPRAGTVRVRLVNGTTNTHTVTQAGHVGNLSPSSAEVSADGGALSTHLAIHSACSWNAQNPNAWIAFSSATNGIGSADLNMTVAPNNSVYARTGTVTIAGQTYTVAQGARAVSIDPTLHNFGTDGGMGTVAVSTEGGAYWESATTQSWISIFSGSTGSGNGNVIYIVNPYASPLSQRIGIVTIAGIAHYVNQMGYTASIDPDVREFMAEGGVQQVNVDVPIGAIWEAITAAPWITIIGGQSGNSSGVVTYVVADNNGEFRSGTIYIAGQPHVVNQARTKSYNTLPYAWEQQYWPGGNSGGATNDFDHDGYSNWQEWWSGSNPTNPLSYFKFAGHARPVGTEFQTIFWPSVTGRIYSVYWLSNLAARSSLTLLDGNVAATPTLNVYTDILHEAAGKGFYRVNVNP